MKEFQTGFLSLIRAALTDSAPAVSKDFDYGRAYELAESQQIVPLVYYGALKDPLFMSHNMAVRFLERTCAYVGHDADQTETVNRICAALEAAGIDYMPLKGVLLKNIYPMPEMRVMGDADILIRTADYVKIQKVMFSLFCVPGPESNHEYNWLTSTGLHIELHKRLIPSYNEDYYAYYGDGWRLAHPVEGKPHRFDMRPEDTFIYLFTHFAKHYRDQGVGMKYVVDFYLYRRHNPDLDMAYIARELDNLQLYTFYENIMRLLDVWFEGAPSDELMDYLTDKLFTDGVFGRSELNAISEGLKLSKTAGSAQKKKKWQLLFPTYKQMCARYPILVNWAILLPLFWIIRGFDLLFNHRERYVQQKKRLDLMTDENISQYQRELNYVGLDYNFGEEAPPDPPKKNDR